MGLLDLLGGVLGKKTQKQPAGLPDLGSLGSILGSLGGGGGTKASGGGGAAVLAALLPLLMNGGLTSILGKLQGGHANALASWIGTGPNDELAPHDVEQVLGADEVARIAQASGVSHDEAREQLAKLLPGVVDHLSPHGSLPGGAGLEGALGKLSGLVG